MASHDDNTYKDVIDAIYREEKKKPDMVNFPPHYCTGKFECIDVMTEIFGAEAVSHFCLCNAFKYLYRTDRKNGVEDIKKAQWYLNKYIELKGETNEDR